MAEITMNLRELDLAYCALSNISQDRDDLRDLASDFADRIERVIKELDPEFGPDSQADDPATSEVTASDDELSALKDGLATLHPDNAAEADGIRSLHEKIDALSASPSPEM